MKTYLLTYLLALAACLSAYETHQEDRFQTSTLSQADNQRAESSIERLRKLWRADKEEKQQKRAKNLRDRRQTRRTPPRSQVTPKSAPPKPTTSQPTTSQPTPRSTTSQPTPQAKLQSQPRQGADPLNAADNAYASAIQADTDIIAAKNRAKIAARDAEQSSKNAAKAAKNVQFSKTSEATQVVLLAERAKAAARRVRDAAKDAKDAERRVHQALNDAIEAKDAAEDAGDASASNQIENKIKIIYTIDQASYKHVDEIDQIVATTDTFAEQASASAEAAEQHPTKPQPPPPQLPPPQYPKPSQPKPPQPAPFTPLHVSTPSGPYYPLPPKTATLQFTSFEAFDTLPLLKDWTGRRIRNRAILNRPVFLQSKAKQIYLLLEVKNLLYNKRNANYRCSWKIRKKGDTTDRWVMSNVNLEIKKSDPVYFFLTHFSIAGSPAGIYTSEIWIDGTLFASREFKIINE